MAVPSRHGEPEDTKMYTNGVSHTNTSTEVQVAAMLWKTQLQTALAMLEDPKRLSSEILGGNEAHLWRYLKKPDGTRFETFAEFCETPRPHGLGSSGEVVNKLLMDLYGARGARLITVPESRQGKRTSGQAVPKSAGQLKAEQRARTINAAPEPIREMYQRDLLGIEDAVLVGRFVVDGFDASAFSARASALLEKLGDREVPTADNRKYKTAFGTWIRGEVEAARAVAKPQPSAPPTSSTASGDDVKEGIGSDAEALAKRAGADPAFAQLLKDLLDPTTAIGGFVDGFATPPDLTSKFPQIQAYATLGDLRRAIRCAPTTNATKTTTRKSNPRPVASAYPIKVTAKKSEEALVTLKKAKFTLVISRVLDAEGQEIENATIEIAVHDRTV